MPTKSRQSDDAQTESPASDTGGRPHDEHEHDDHEACHESVPAATRAAVLDDYSHKCQACGRRGPEEGGLAELHIHHIERDPDGVDEHAEANLTVMCRSCHEWLHQQVDPSESPVRITDADRTVLLTQDIEILQVLADDGPLRTGAVATGWTADLTVSSVRERLWVLMGLDNHVDERDQPLVDKDVETGEWGLVDQIETSARGHIPDDDQLLLQRMEDEQVRRALDRGCDREAIMDVLDVSERSTFYKLKRACAYDFPLDAFSRGGRPAEEARNQEVESKSGGDSLDAQQRLDDVSDADDLGRTETWGSDDEQADDPTADTATLLSELAGAEASKSSESGDGLQQEVDAAIETLEALRGELE
jgi:hypothetical protein